MSGKWIGLFLMLGLCVTSCQNASVDHDDPILTKREQKYADLGTLFDDDFLAFGGGSRRAKKGESGLAVNSFLWRATLDTLSFIPLQSVDPFGGVILTDWYISSETPLERLKVNVFILGRQLRADGLKVTVFRQKFFSGRWVDQPVDDATSLTLEDIILSRARQLRVKNIS